MREAFAISHIFNKKYWHISDINIWNLNETLTNDIVSFERLDPDQSLLFIIKLGWVNACLACLVLAIIPPRVLFPFEVSFVFFNELKTVISTTN